MATKDVGVVLAHGAWADGSSWCRVIAALRGEGVNVTAAPLPLTSLADDVAALNRSMERTDKPVILVGHAYAGAVIALARPERVKALIYVAALAPDQGERSRTCSIAPNRIRRHQSSRLTTTVWSGCLKLPLQRRSRKTHPPRISRCSRPCSGR
jgi:pimeloyl-ACP methyl ester carboxylesterase